MHIHNDSCYAHKHIASCYTVHKHTGNTTSGGGCYGTRVPNSGRVPCSACAGVGVTGGDAGRPISRSGLETANTGGDINSHGCPFGPHPGGSMGKLAYLRQYSSWSQSTVETRISVCPYCNYIVSIAKSGITYKKCTACNSRGFTFVDTWSLNCGKTEGTSYLVCGKTEDLTTICGL